MSLNQMPSAHAFAGATARAIARRSADAIAAIDRIGRAAFAAPAADSMHFVMAIPFPFDPPC